MRVKVFILFALVLGLGTANAYAQRNVLFSMCNFRLDDSYMQANLNFTQSYIFTLDSNGTPDNVVRILGKEEYVPDEAANACMKNWKFDGFSKGMRFAVSFGWVHGIGWTHASIVGNGFSQKIVPVQAQINDRNIEELISELYSNPWPGAEIVGESPTEWEFQLTEPMRNLLSIGPSAQNALLDNIRNQQIKDQVIFILGGIGNEAVIEPIINAMVAKDDIKVVPNAYRINRAANLALTNITVADVIWHHGGGIVMENCQEDQKTCWANWWKKNKNSFSIAEIKQSRRYSNYPNYGIYRNLEPPNVPENK